MAGINQIPKLSYWASSTDVNKMITSLNQALLTLQSKALIVANASVLPTNLEDGSLAVTRDTFNMYVFTAGAWQKIVTV